MTSPVSYTHLDVYKRQINNDKPTAVGAVDGLRPVLMAKAATESCLAGGVYVKVGE